MAMFSKLRIVHTDGSEVVAEGRTADVVKWERRFKQPASTMWDDGGLYTEHLWFFAWLAEFRDSEPVPFDEWVDTVDMVAIVPDEDAEAPPTNPVSSPTP